MTKEKERKQNKLNHNKNAKIKFVTYISERFWLQSLSFSCCVFMLCFSCCVLTDFFQRSWLHSQNFLMSCLSGKGEVLTRFRPALVAFTCNPKIKTSKLCKKDIGTPVRNVLLGTSKIGGNSLEGFTMGDLTKVIHWARFSRHHGGTDD